MATSVLSFSRSGAYTTQDWGDELNYTVSQNATFPAYSRVTAFDLNISAGLVSGTASARTCYIGIQLESNGSWHTVLSDHGVYLGGSASTGAVTINNISIPSNLQTLFGTYGITGICITQDDGDISIRGKAGSGTATFYYQDDTRKPTLDSSYPQDANVMPGKSVTMQVKVTDTGYPTSLSYQWYKNGSVVSGATGSTLTITPSEASAQYHCVVTNATGSVTSRTATIVRYSLPVLNSAYPANASITPGASTTLSVQIATAGNPASYTYQWYKNGKAISGATSASITTNETGQYYCVVTNTAGSVTSRTAVVALASGGALWANGVKVPSTAYIRHNDAWVVATPYCYSGGAWKPCSSG